MCGRYRLSRRKQIIEEHFDSISGEEDWVPRYNIAPTQPVPITRQNPKEPVRRLSLVRWGLIPSWAKDSSGAAMMINARSATAATKPVFCDALKSRRFLVPADGFYEWRRTGKTKQPFCFEVNDGSLFAFAGLWDRWKDPNGTWVKSCSILTKCRTLNSGSPQACQRRKRSRISQVGRWSSPLERQGDYTDMFSIYESAAVTG
jgi:putative SOS response-associated peptidase YedK